MPVHATVQPAPRTIPLADVPGGLFGVDHAQGFFHRGDAFENLLHGVLFEGNHPGVQRGLAQHMRRSALQDQFADLIINVISSKTPMRPLYPVPRQTGTPCPGKK